VILDNLIAGGKAVPMVVVMPVARAEQSNGVGPARAPNPDRNLFEKDLPGDILPYKQLEVMAARDFDFDSRADVRQNV
jgi:hypothetical protein